ncbi:MAG: hypothetical protein AAF585_06745 [Verrucomicrobiota bacterium]
MTAAEHQQSSEARMRDMLVNGGALLISLFVHLFALVVIGVYLFFLSLAHEWEYAEPEKNEVVISLEELIPEEILTPEPIPQEKMFVDVFPDQESPVAPDQAVFESDRNSVAMTDNAAAADPDAPPVPTQDGEELPRINLRERRFVDAEVAEEAMPNSAAAPAGAAPSPDTVPTPPKPEMTNPQLTEAIPTTSAPRPSEIFDVTRQTFLDVPDRHETEDAEKKDREVGEVGGAQDPLEVAKIDMEKVRNSFSDDLEVIDERTPLETDVEDTAPMENPDAEDPERPEDMLPAPPPNAPIVPTPIMPKEQSTPPPSQPGAQPSVDMQGAADAIAFNPERYNNKMKGSLSNQGPSSALDVEATALGAYKKKVSQAIERRWHQLRLQNMQYVTFGSLKVAFEVNSGGKVSRMRVVHDDSNAVMTDFSLKAINSADIPPMPPEVSTLLGNDGLEITYDIIVF